MFVLASASPLGPRNMKSFAMPTLKVATQIVQGYFNWDKPTNQIGIFNWVYD
jgi:hypothetical protein